ncbi:uncharacterized protein LOC123653867 [Melitaea cinxia]|uniref:uncharacterized protein LOC123653867 n=1 Tax=Melitaea cinxia TaxID=113334 RepID=UPI001E273860|nr:uncharacterized protein LOC123653867 [Melitaea cinxia]
MASWTVASVLAGNPPWKLQAEILAEIYHFVAARRSRGEPPTLEEIVHMRRQAQDTLLRRWTEDLSPPVFSGHGCFGKYLHQITRQKATPACHKFGVPEDTALHTLEVCAAWDSQRRALSAVLGRDLSLPSIVAKPCSTARDRGKRRSPSAKR